MAPRSADERLARMHELDLKRQTGLHQTQLIHRDEEARRLKLRVLQLQDENDLLQDKLTQKDSRLADNLRQGKGMRADVESAKAAARLAEAKYKKQTTELNNLRAEVQALNGSSQDSAKTLQEKFALARELNRLKPELEHLQSQLLSYQAVVAEKNDLRRQVDSLEVELESEKRSKSKPRAKDSSEASSDVKAKLEDLEKQVEQEKKERERMKMAYERELAEANNLNDRIEERALTLKTKLKTAQAELKKTQGLLADSREDPKQAAAAGKKAKQSNTTKADASKKRGAQEIADDMANVGTPGYDDVMSKRARRRGPEHMAIAEKSTFSVTPFLNRSKSLGEDSLDAVTPTEKGNGRTVSFSDKPEISATPHFADDSEPRPESGEPVAKQGEEEMEEDCEAPGMEWNETLGTALSTAKPQAVAKTKATALGKTAASTSNLMASPPKRKPAKQAKSKAVNSITDDGSEVETGSADLPKTQPGPMLSAPLATTSKAGETEGSKRKRKLLGGAATNLFDDGEEDVPKRAAKTQLGQTRKPKTALGGVKNAFATGGFSPLKRDRRGVGASFLA